MVDKRGFFDGGAEGSRTPAKPDAAHLASQLDPLGFASLKKRFAFCGQGFDDDAAGRRLAWGGLGRGWESPPNELKSMRRSRGDPPKKTAPLGAAFFV